MTKSTFLLLLCLINFKLSIYAQEEPYLVKDINAIGMNYSSYISNTISINGIIYFSASEGVYGKEWWYRIWNCYDYGCFFSISLTFSQGYIYYDFNDGVYEYVSKH